MDRVGEIEQIRRFVCGTLILPIVPSCQVNDVVCDLGGDVWVPVTIPSHPRRKPHRSALNGQVHSSVLFQRQDQPPQVPGQSRPQALLHDVKAAAGLVDGRGL